MVSKAIGKKNSNKIYKNIYKYKYNKNQQDVKKICKATYIGKI